MHPSGTSSARRRGALGLVVAVVAATVGLTTTPASADGLTFTVDSTVDAVDANIGNGVCATAAGACTLRAAVQEANATTAADTIVLASGQTYTLSIPGIDGNASAGDLDLTNSVTIQGNGAEIRADGPLGDRVFQVAGGTTDISHVTIIAGNGPGSAIRVNVAGTLHLSHAHLFDATKQGAVYVLGSASIDSTTITASDAGNNSTAAGVAVSSSGNATIARSTIAANGTGIANQGNLTISHSTIGPNASMEIRHVAATVYLYATIIDNPDTSQECSGTGGSIVSQGHNIASDNTCSLTHSTDSADVDPLLGDLGYNGSASPVMLPTRFPRPTSSAVDAVPLGSCTGHTDQRGVTTQGAACDIGAVEFDTAVTVYGPQDQFRSLGELDTDQDERVTSLTGETIRLHGLDDGHYPALPAGLSAFFPTMTDTGRVVMGTMPTTGNNTSSTATRQVISTFDPLAPGEPQLAHTSVPLRSLEGSVLLDGNAPRYEAFQHLHNYPTGYLTSGGADVSDVCTVGSGPAQRVMATSASPFKNWHVNPGEVWQVTHTKLDGQGAWYKLTIDGLPGTATTATIWGGNDAATVEDAIQSAINGPLGGTGNDVQVTLTSSASSGATTRAYLLTFRERLSDQDVTVQVVNPSTGWESTPTAVPYDSRHFGTYPSIIGLDPTTGTIDENVTATANQLHSASPEAPEAAFSTGTFGTAFGEGTVGDTPIYSTRLIAECAPLDNGHVAITQYALTAGTRAGRLAVVDPSTSAVVASIQLPTAPTLPECPDGAGNVIDNRCIPLTDSQTDLGCPSEGCSVNLSPRDVAAAASGTGYEISIVYDALVDVATVLPENHGASRIAAPYPVQVLHYNPAGADFAQRLTIKTPLIIPNTGSAQHPARYNQTIMTDGHLFAAVSDAVNYSPTRGIDVFDLASNGDCPLTGGWPEESGVDTWEEAPEACRKSGDLSTWESPVTVPRVTMALDYDPERNLLLATTSQGILRVLHWDESTQLLTRVRDVDLGGYHLMRTSCTPVCGLADRAQSIHKGALDSERGVYYLSFAGSEANYVLAVDLDLVATADTPP